MVNPKHLTLLCVLAFPCLGIGQTANRLPASAAKPAVSFETLTDTHGTRLNAYLATLARELRYDMEHSAMTSDGGPSWTEPVDLRIAISSEGKLTASRLETPLTPAGRNALMATQRIEYPPLPNGVGPGDLKLRVHLTPIQSAH